MIITIDEFKTYEQNLINKQITIMSNIYKELESKYMFTNDMLCMSIMWTEQFEKALNKEDSKTESEKKEYLKLLKSRIKEIEKQLKNAYNY